MLTKICKYISQFFSPIQSFYGPPVLFFFKSIPQQPFLDLDLLEVLEWTFWDLVKFRKYYSWKPELGLDFGLAWTGLAQQDQGLKHTQHIANWNIRMMLRVNITDSSTTVAQKVIDLSFRKIIAN